MKKRFSLTRILSLIFSLIRGVRLLGVVVDFLDDWLDLI